MPIRPENRARYPKNWPDIRAHIRRRSGDRCECTGQCAGKHGLTRCHAVNGMPIDDLSGPCIVLTVAHLDHQPENCADDNLLHMCQGCHLRYDAPRKHREMAERRRAQRASGDLFPSQGDTNANDAPSGV